MNTIRQFDLLRKPRPDPRIYHQLTSADAGWESLNFCAVRLKPGEEYDHSTRDHECVLVVLGGTCTVSSSRGTWKNIGRRPDVFSGMPYGLYLPRNTDVRVSVEATGVDLALGWCPADKDFPARLVTPDQIAVELRGGGNASRQINSIVPPSSPGQRMMAVEVYTPPGNWSSYPPHKHDHHRVDGSGALLEADLEEVYFYKIDRPEGFAIQRIYTDDRTLDRTIVATNDDLVLIPRGYHPVAAAPGYTVYYLNFLAGSAKSLASADDPAYAWVKQAWPPLDPRVPLVSLSAEPR
jgi:5-deoxy-glucuronate isomerase